MSLTISPIKDEAGRVVGASKIVRDVTEQRQAEASASASSLAEAAAANRQFRAFFDRVRCSPESCTSTARSKRIGGRGNSCGSQGADHRRPFWDGPW